MEEARSALETILDRGLVHSLNGTVVYESVLEREFPDIDIRLLCDIYAEKLGDPQAVVEDYLSETQPKVPAGR